MPSAGKGGAIAAGAVVAAAAVPVPVPVGAGRTRSTTRPGKQANNGRTGVCSGSRRVDARWNLAIEVKGSAAERSEVGRAAATATTRIEHSSSSNAERQGQGRKQSDAVGKRACRGRGRKDHETVAGRWHVCEEREEAQGERERSRGKALAQQVRRGGG